MPPTPEMGHAHHEYNHTQHTDGVHDEDDYSNIMYYHYKYNNTSFSHTLQNEMGINANEYISRYNNNEDIPPFVSPPINPVKKNNKYASDGMPAYSVLGMCK